MVSAIVENACAPSSSPRFDAGPFGRVRVSLRDGPKPQSTTAGVHRRRPAFRDCDGRASMPTDIQVRVSMAWRLSDFSRLSRPGRERP